MTEEALMKLIADELKRQLGTPGESATEVVRDSGINLRELARAILAAPDLQTVHIPKYDLTKDKLP